MNKEELKELMECDPKYVELKNLTRDDIYRLSIGGFCTRFEAFFLPSNFKKLYVCLSSVGVDRRSYPIFHRVTWSNFFDGSFLFLDDPTRNETQIAPTYFFGNRDTNYLDYVCDIIKKFLNLYDLTNNELCFISSSNGGFASLYCTKKFPYSTCIVFNPQLDIPLFFGKNDKFEKAMNIKFNMVNTYDRINVYDIIEEKKSKVCIYSNLKCESDKIQMEYFFNSIGHKIKYGLNKINNIWFIIANIDSNNPHLVQPNQYMTKVIEMFMDKNMEITDDKCLVIDAFLNYMRDIYRIESKNN